MLDWLYGPRFPEYVSPHGIMLRNLTIDVDTLFDVAREIPKIVERSGILPQTYPVGQDGAGTVPIKYESNTTYTLRDRTLTEEEVRKLGVPDRNQLELTVITSLWKQTEEGSYVPAGEMTVRIEPRWANIATSVADQNSTRRVLEEVGNYLYDNGDQRPDWPGVRWLAWLIPIPIALAAWIWTAFTVPLPAPAHLLILAIIALASFSSIARASTGVQAIRQHHVRNSIRFRGESRERTYQRRADTRQNFKVGLITAPIGIAVGVVGTLLTAFAK